MIAHLAKRQYHSTKVVSFVSRPDADQAHGSGQHLFSLFHNAISKSMSPFPSHTASNS